MPDRHLWTRHSTKTITFTGAAGAGAAGTVTVFTITGRVFIHQITAFCTTLLTATGAATLSFGTAGDIDAFIAITTATDIDANEWWGTSTPAVDSYSPVVGAATGGYTTQQERKWLSNNAILTVATADVSTGAIVFDVIYTPLTDGARLA